MRVREIAAAVRVLAKGDLARYHAGGTSETAQFEAELRRRWVSSTRWR